MYRKVIPEVLRQKILKDTAWRLKLSAQLLLNDSLDGQWNATSGDRAGAEQCSPETLLRLHRWVSGVFTSGSPGWGGCAGPEPGQSPARARPGAPTAPQLEGSEPLSPTQDKQLHGKCRLRDMYISRHTLFSEFACILAEYLLPKLTVKLQKHVKPQKSDLNLVGEKENNLNYLHSYWVKLISSKDY